MLFSLAGCGSTTSAPAETADETYLNKGYTLTIPAKYDDLLFTTTPEEDGKLFVCSEIASIEAAQELGQEYDTAGRLFSIETIDEAALNAWARTVPETFLSDNTQLTAVKYGNTDLDMYLARIAFDKDIHYTISTLEFLELEPKDVDPAPYLEKLRNNVTYEPVDEEAPDGEYIVLNFPDEHVRFDFFYSDEKVNYVRETWGENDEWEQVYKANFDDSSINITDIMQEWYDALAVANGKK